MSSCEFPPPTPPFSEPPPPNISTSTTPALTTVSPDTPLADSTSLKTAAMDVDTAISTSQLRSYKDALTITLSSTSTTTATPPPSAIRYQPKLSTHDSSVPVISFGEEQLWEDRDAHALSLIAQFRTGRVPICTLLARLPKVSCTHGTMDIVELQNNFLLCIFTSPIDSNRVRLGSPWTIAGKPLILTPWVPNFDPTRAYIATMLVSYG